MELLVYDSEFVGRGVLDIFDSIVWVDRYSACGDVEIETTDIMKTLSFVTENCYLTFRNSTSMMIVETINIKTDLKNGNKLIIKGRSLESILDRRIIWNQTILTGSLQNGIKKLLDENAITPADPDRAIPGLIFSPSTDPAITALNVDAQFTGDNLYEAISKLCTSANIGFKIVRTDTGQFVFSLYSGTDRSYNQSTNDYVVFSPKYDNFVSGDYLETIKLLKTVSLVGGEGEGAARVMVTATLGDTGGAGLYRRETFTNASSISKTIEGGTLTDEEYEAQLLQKGYQDLAETLLTLTAFEGQIQPNELYQFGTDFFMGDILQVADEYGHEGMVQITEFIHMQDSSGEKMYPTFATVT